MQGLRLRAGAGSVCRRTQPFTNAIPRSSVANVFGAFRARSAPISAYRADEDLTQLKTSSSAKAIDNTTTFLATFGLYLLSSSPAMADAIVAENPFAGVQSNSLIVTLVLFLMCVPGIWSQVKRAPQATKKRKVFEVPGPKQEGAMPVTERAKSIFRYFKKYNYEVKEMGEVITFVGLYAANTGQAAAVTFYTFIGLGCIALVLSTVMPDVGGWWYLLTLLSPGAWFYYFRKGERQEEFKVKIVTADNEMTSDIIVEGDQEEIARMSKELDLVEKGMIRVKGIFESA